MSGEFQKVEIGEQHAKSLFWHAKNENSLSITMLGKKVEDGRRRENALMVINSSVDRIQIESLPANRVIVASAELLHTRRFPSIWKIPLVLNKCFTLADLLGIFICGVAAAATAAMLPSATHYAFTPCA